MHRRADTSDQEHHARDEAPAQNDPEQENPQREEPVEPPGPWAKTSSGDADSVTDS